LDSVPPQLLYLRGSKNITFEEDCVDRPSNGNLIMMYLTVPGLPPLMETRCGERCGLEEKAGMDAGAPTQTGCAHLTMAGDPLLYDSAIPVKGRLDLALHAVKCCSPIGSHPVNSATYGCHEMKTYWEAKSICEAVGLRLCTKDEIFSCRVCNTGCGFDRERIWSSDVVGTCVNEDNHPASVAEPNFPNDSIAASIEEIEDLMNINAELVGALAEHMVVIAQKVRDLHPTCVTSINGVKIEIEADEISAITLLTPETALQSLILCQKDIPHGEMRYPINELLQILVSYKTAFTGFINGGPGTNPTSPLDIHSAVPVAAPVAAPSPGSQSTATPVPSSTPFPFVDPDRVNTAICNGQGVFTESCLCAQGKGGFACEEEKTPEESYQDGWRRGYEAAARNKTNSEPTPSDVARAFDLASKLLKSTTMNMAEVDPAWEATVPTLCLSPVEIMFHFEDSQWLSRYRDSPISQFRAMLPKVLKEATLMRREYDDVAILLKHLAMKVATTDCLAMKSLALGDAGGEPACGDVAQILTEMDALTILDRLLDPSGTKHLEDKLRHTSSEALRITYDEMLLLVEIVHTHSQCHKQCGGCHGTCQQRQCHCFTGWMGMFCEYEVPLADGECPRECSHHGKCMEGRCRCDPGWKEFDCSVSTACLNNCTGHGDCIDTVCYCDKGWEGEDCSRFTERCPVDYKCLHGTCTEGKCHCEHGWTGDDCTIGDFFANQDQDGFFSL